MVRVMIVDRPGLERDKLVYTLSRHSDLEIVDCVSDAGAALASLDGCDLVIISADLANDGAYELTRAVKRSEKCVHVVILGSNEPKSVIVRLVEAGALGYVRRSSGPDELIRSLVSVGRGEAHLPPEVTASIVSRLADLTDWFEELQPLPEGAQALTRREREVLHLIGRDYTNQDIANHLIIEVGTVKNHVHNILAKLKVNSRREAAATYLALMRSQTYRPARNRRTTPVGVDRYMAAAR